MFGPQCLCVSVAEGGNLNERQIAIVCPEERLEENGAIRARLAACQEFRVLDRPPVVFSLSYRFLREARRAGIGDYFENPRAQLEQQLLNQKWVIENLRDDRVTDTEKMTVAPDLQDVRGGYFPIRTVWAEGIGPMASPILERPEDVAALEVPEPTANLYGRKIEWYYAMKEMAGDYAVTLNGRPIPVEVSVGGGGGPFPDAYALARDRIFLWVYEAPETVHQLMDKVTTAFINYQRYTRELTGRTMRDLGMGADAAEMMSVGMFREFVLPYYLRCYEAFPGTRGLHMCGRIDHLLSLLTGEMGITHLNGFGSPTDPRLLADVMGGQVVMSGGVDPVLLLRGAPDEVKQECRRYLETFAPVGGYILQDGNNLAPGTPMANLRAMCEVVGGG